jgi:hypothetical protein
MTINVAQMTTWIWSGRSYALICFEFSIHKGIGVLSNPSLGTQTFGTSLYDTTISGAKLGV